jgi:MOSC domain-containing protein YiiM
LQPSIIQVNISPGGLPKRPIPEAFIHPLGLEGDSFAHPQFHGGPKKAVLLIASEAIDELRTRGFPVFYGALGENLTTRGLNYRDLRIGDWLRAGGALIEITQARVPCSALDVYGETLKREIFDKQMDYTSPLWGMSGFKASVVEPGPVRPGDIISVVAKLA